MSFAPRHATYRRPRSTTTSHVKRSPAPSSLKAVDSESPSKEPSLPRENQLSREATPTSVLHSLAASAQLDSSANNDSPQSGSDRKTGSSDWLPDQSVSGQTEEGTTSGVSSGESKVSKPSEPSTTAKEDIEKLREQALARARSLDPRKNRKMGFAEFINTIGLDRDADTEVIQAHEMVTSYALYAIVHDSHKSKSWRFRALVAAVVLCFVGLALGFDLLLSHWSDFYTIPNLYR